MSTGVSISGQDRRILRDLARRVAEIGSLPEQAVKREMWKRHNRLEKVKPMVLVFPEGSWTELLPLDSLVTTHPVARRYEWWLRHIVYRWEHLRDDQVIEPRVNVSVVVHHNGWGMEAGELESAESEAARGAVKYDPAIKEPEDFAKMRQPELRVSLEDLSRWAVPGPISRALSREANRVEWVEVERRADIVRDVIGDILPVRIHRRLGIETGLTDTLARLRGADNLMLDMCLRPEWVHEVMSFMTEATMKLLDQAEAESLFDLNNEDDYVGSGGVGYTDELPSAGYDGQHARLIDRWGFATSQQFVLVSPAMHEEFSLRYQKQLLARFGLNCYGCCEPLTSKWDIVKQIPRLRRVSVSPWADVHVAAEALQDKIIFSWKPKPAEILLHNYEEAIRQSIAVTLEAAKGCVLEMILKDTHTCNNQPERMRAWVRIANEMTAKESASVS